MHVTRGITLPLMCVCLLCWYIHVCLFVLQSTVHGIRGEKLPLRTSIDLELDLQASKTKYTQLHDEIRRLRELHSLLENAKAKGLKIQTFDAWLFLKNKSLTIKKYNILPLFFFIANSSIFFAPLSFTKLQPLYIFLY